MQEAPASGFLTSSKRYSAFLALATGDLVLQVTRIHKVTSRRWKTWLPYARHLKASCHGLSQAYSTILNYGFEVLTKYCIIVDHVGDAGQLL